MIHLYEDETRPEHLVYRRPKRGVMAKFLQKTMPSDPKPSFVWPELAVQAGRIGYFSTRKLAILSALLITITVGMIALLFQVPFLDQSVVTLLTHGFEIFIPSGWATSVAWIVGMIGTLLIGGFTDYDDTQRQYQSRPATKSKIYNFMLMAALWEEQAFRSGGEKWSWPQRIRASIIFGVIHITNIWYSLASGIALGLTGLGFMMVYLWYYRKTRNATIATAASATVHALYNVMALVVLVGALAVGIVMKFFA